MAKAAADAGAAMYESAMSGITQHETSGQAVEMETLLAKVKDAKQVAWEASQTWKTVQKVEAKKREQLQARVQGIKSKMLAVASAADEGAPPGAEMSGKIVPLLRAVRRVEDTKPKWWSAPTLPPTTAPIVTSAESVSHSHTESFRG